MGYRNKWEWISWSYAVNLFLLRYTCFIWDTFSWICQCRGTQNLPQMKCIVFRAFYGFDGWWLLTTRLQVLPVVWGWYGVNVCIGPHTVHPSTNSISISGFDIFLGQVFSILKSWLPCWHVWCLKADSLYSHHEGCMLWKHEKTKSLYSVLIRTIWSKAVPVLTSSSETPAICSISRK